MCLIILIVLKVRLTYLLIKKVYHSVVFLLYVVFKYIVLCMKKLICAYACTCMHMQAHVSLSMHVYV